MNNLVTVFSLSFAVLVLGFFVAMYHLGIVECLVGQYNKNGNDNDAWVLVLSLVLLGGILGIFLILFSIGGIEKQSLNDWEANLLFFGDVGISITTYFLVHYCVRSMLIFFFPGTTFRDRHLAEIVKLGEKRNFQKFGTRWLTNMV